MVSTRAPARPRAANSVLAASSNRVWRSSRWPEPFRFALERAVPLLRRVDGSDERSGCSRSVSRLKLHLLTLGIVYASFQPTSWFCLERVPGKRRRGARMQTESELSRYLQIVQ